jgi:hypothetical protein
VEKISFLLDTSAGSKKVSKTFVCWEFIHSFSQCGCFEGVLQMFCGVCSLTSLLLQTSANN